METRAKHLAGGALIAAAAAPLFVSTFLLAVVLVDGGLRLVLEWLLMLGLAGAALNYGIKLWGRKRRQITIGVLCTSVGVIDALITFTFPIVINSKAWRIAGGSTAEGRMAYAFALYTIVLLAVGIPMIMYQRSHGGLYSWRRDHNIRTGAKIRPGDRPVRGNYRPD